MIAVDALHHKSKRGQVYNGVASSFLTLFQRIKTGLFQILTVTGLKGMVKQVCLPRGNTVEIVDSYG